MHAFYFSFKSFFIKSLFILNLCKEITYVAIKKSKWTDPRVRLSLSSSRLLAVFIQEIKCVEHFCGNCEAKDLFQNQRKILPSDGSGCNHGTAQNHAQIQCHWYRFVEPWDSLEPCSDSMPLIQVSRTMGQLKTMLRFIPLVKVSRTMGQIRTMLRFKPLVQVSRTMGQLRTMPRFIPLVLLK